MTECCAVHPKGVLLVSTRFYLRSLHISLALILLPCRSQQEVSLKRIWYCVVGLSSMYMMSHPESVVFISTAAEIPQSRVSAYMIFRFLY